MASRQRIMAELGTLERPFDRYAGPVHVTGSAVLVGPRGTVLHRHRKLGRWLQPGGHVDPGESPWEAAVRETSEETGLAGAHPNGAPELFHLDVHSSGDHVHLDLRYLLSCADEEPSPGLGESPDVKWFTVEEALEVADPGLVDALSRLLTSPKL